MNSNTNVNKSTNVQRGDKLNFFEKTKKVQSQGMKRLSSPLFNINKNSNKNNNNNHINNNLVDYTSSKNRATSKAAFDTRKVFSASPRRNNDLEVS
jgi:hypothetical protein